MAQLSQIGTSAFTQDQYDQILRMINKSNVTHKQTESVETNAANMASIANFFLDFSKVQEWIIDTGVTNDMISDLSLLDKISIVEHEHPKVFLPSGDTTVVTHIGRSCLTEENILPNFST